MKKTLQRITNIDIKRISEANLSDHGIYIEFDESNICKARAMIIGPSGSLYEGGYLFFSINFPNNYPYSPPVIKYHSQNNIRIHPNIYVNGKSLFIYFRKHGQVRNGLQQWILLMY